MPNWVDNNIKIKGTKENVQKLMEALTETIEMKDYVNDTTRSHIRICDSLFPQPKELNYVSEGSNQNGDSYWWTKNEDGEKVHENYFIEEKIMGIDSSKLKQVNLTIEEMIEMTLKYDSFNWYDWRLLYWGSKSGDLHTEIVNTKDNEIQVYCESAWNPLGRLFERISEEWDVNVEIQWLEESGYYGTIEIENGKLIKNDKDWKDIYNIDYIGNLDEGVTNEEE